MQLRDEGAVVFVLRRDQDSVLPAGREEGDALTVRMFDIGAKAARLHRYRTIRQTDRRDIAIGPDPGLAPDLPRQALVRQLELMRCADQGRLVGVAEISLSPVCQTSHHSQPAILPRSTQALANPKAALSAPYMPTTRPSLR